jgi:glutamate dehydrogenase
LDAHRLRREIASLCVVNRLVDAGGAALFTSLQDELGADVPAAAAALLMAEDAMRVSELRERIVLEAAGSRRGAYSALVELDEGVRRVARFLVKAGIGALHAERASRWRSELDGLFDALRDFLAPAEVQRLDARHARFVEQGLPLVVADRLATLLLADRGLNILRIAEASSMPPIETARVYTRLGEEAGFNWMYERLVSSHSGTSWDRMAMVDLRHELLDLQRGVTQCVLVGRGEPSAALKGFLGEHATDIARIRELQQRAAAAATPSALSVIAARLQRLRPASGSEA